MGNFGYAAEKMTNHGQDFGIAVLAATPDFGRHTAFGNHVASFSEDIVRLDRHQSMSSHPRTPMQEADLRLHLKSLCRLKFTNVYLPDIAGPQSALAATVDAVFNDDKSVIFDSVSNTDVAKIAQVL